MNLGAPPSRAAAAFCAAIVLAALAWLCWPARAPAETAINAREFGERSDASLIAVEPFLRAHDYRSADALRARLSAYLDIASEKGWVTTQSLVVFPEHVGTWLVAAEAPAAAYRAKAIDAASLAIIADDPVAFVRSLVASKESDRLAAALFRARGPAMAADYQETFGALAGEYGAMVVAGSIVLENPAVEDGKLVTRRGDLYNVSAVFRADGSIVPRLVFKQRPIPSEAGFISAGAAGASTIESAAGRVGVLICADSWHPELYAELADAELIAVPAFLQRNGGWTIPWGGYATPTPDDIDGADVGALTEGEAWRKYAMPARILATGADAGATAFLRGAPWDLGADGRTLLIAKSGSHVGDATQGGAVSAVWR